MQSIVVWCNYHLKSTGAEISDIVTDFADGVNFALLIQSLTKQTIKINQNPKTYQEKMENIRGSFNALESIGAKPKGCTPEGTISDTFYNFRIRFCKRKCQRDHGSYAFACWKIQRCFQAS